jgi:hypothetical protein
MIKVVMLLLRPAPTWERISQAHRSVIFIFGFFLLPLIAFCSAGEVYGLTHWPKRYSKFGDPGVLSFATAIDYALVQFLLTLLVVFGCAYVLKALSETFHSRHSYVRAFATLGYSLSPLFAIRLLHAAPGVRWWMVWAIGIAFALAILYYGLVRVMQPDPTHALGLYFMTSMLVIITTFLAQLVASLVLKSKLEVFAPLLR